MILDNLRKLMLDNKLDAYIILTSDPHNSEYLAKYYKEREYLTNFSGSQGTAIVTKDEAYLWADGRYFEQAEKQIANSGFKLMKIGVKGYPTVIEYLKNLKVENIGYNALYMPISEYDSFTSEIPNSNFIDIDLFKDLWKDRKFDKSKSFSHAKWNDRSTSQKIELIREKLEEHGGNSILVTSLEAVSWISNSRGKDIECVPVTFAYIIITDTEAKLFVDKDKISDFKDELEENFAIYDYSSIDEELSKIKDKKFILSPQTNTRLYKTIEKNNQILSKVDIVGEIKSIKSEGELKNIRQAHIRDGVILTKFMYWLKNNDLSNETEWTCQNRLDNARAEDPRYLDLSFNTISAYGANASMMHYSASKDSAANIENHGFLLVDSGGQYLDGTTDITRTFAVGELTQEEKNHFTYVLKSHLQLMHAKFPSTAKSLALDAIARKEVWAINEDYRCGTGHGIGYVLGVHERPPFFNPSAEGLMKPGMIISNEPGIYKEGKHGIRIENILEVVEDEKNEYGDFYKFNTISFAPIDLDAVEVSLLTDDEIIWLNNYHEEVYLKLNEFMNDEEREWLKKYTRKINR